MDGQRLWKRVVASLSPILICAFVYVVLMWALMGPWALIKASAVLGIAYVGLALSAVAITRFLFGTLYLSRAFSAAMILVAVAGYGNE
jgi:hypothetical protein